MAARGSRGSRKPVAEPRLEGGVFHVYRTRRAAERLADHMLGVDLGAEELGGDSRNLRSLLVEGPGRAR